MSDMGDLEADYRRVLPDGPTLRHVLDLLALQQRIRKDLELRHAQGIASAADIAESQARYAAISEEIRSEVDSYRESLM